MYLPQGRYRVTRHLQIPPGVELRGVNDFMPRGAQSKTLLIADLPGDQGKVENPPFISLQSSEKLGGSGVAGLAIWYPNQDFRDVKAYPWTIRSMGPRCWVQRVYLGNCYNAVDFATHPNDHHVLSRICGSALNTAFFVGNTPTIGWIDNCHIRPQDWAAGSANEVHEERKQRIRGLRDSLSPYPFEIPGDRYAKPLSGDISREAKHSLIPNLHGSGAIVVGSGANAQITAFFTNGATRAFDFVDHDGSGGGNANVLIGGSEAAWGAWIKQLGPKGLNLVNFSFNPMTRLDYILNEHIPSGNMAKGLALRIDSSVGDKASIEMIMPKFYGRGDIALGCQQNGGNLVIHQGIVENGYKQAFLDKRSGTVAIRNSKTVTTISEHDTKKAQ